LSPPDEAPGKGRNTLIAGCRGKPHSEKEGEQHMATFIEKQQLAGTTHRRMVEAFSVIKGTGGEREIWLWSVALTAMGRVLDYYGTERPALEHDDEQGAGE